jgi:hypothetical protein
MFYMPAWQREMGEQHHRQSAAQMQHINLHWHMCMCMPFALLSNALQRAGLTVKVLCLTDTRSKLFDGSPCSHQTPVAPTGLKTGRVCRATLHPVPCSESCRTRVVPIGFRFSDKPYRHIDMASILFSVLAASLIVLAVAQGGYRTCSDDVAVGPNLQDALQLS